MKKKVFLFIILLASSALLCACSEASKVNANLSNKLTTLSAKGE